MGEIHFLKYLRKVQKKRFIKQKGGLLIPKFRSKLEKIVRIK